MALGFAAATLGCVVAYQQIGDRVNKAAFLREPFGMIPLAWLFLALAATSAASFALLRVKGTSNKRIERTLRGQNWISAHA